MYQRADTIAGPKTPCHAFVVLRSSNPPRSVDTPLDGGAVFACSEAGLDAAIAAGGGPHTFSCAGPTTVTTSSEKVFTIDVVLDGGRNLDIEASPIHRVFTINAGVAVELRNLGIEYGWGDLAGGILNRGTLTLRRCRVTNNYAFETCASCTVGGGVASLGADATLTVIESTISNNTTARAGWTGGGIAIDEGSATIRASTIVANSTTAGIMAGGGIMSGAGSSALIENSTISQNHVGGGTVFSGGGIAGPALEIRYTTLAANTCSNANQASAIFGGPFVLAGNVIEGDCRADSSPPVAISEGGNVESPGDTCNLTDPTDQPNVTALALALGPLEDNGGPTETHAPEGTSVAVDAAGACPPPAEDQRGIQRPQDSACDAGSVEVAQPLAAPTLSPLGLVLLAGLLLAAPLLRARRMDQSQ